MMSTDAGIPIKEMRVDGGASANDFLMQFQADILDVRVDRPAMVETTALGAAFLAGMGVGFWKGAEELGQARRGEKIFEPSMSEQEREPLYNGWKEAVSRVRSKRDCPELTLTPSQSAFSRCRGAPGGLTPVP